MGNNNKSKLQQIPRKIHYCWFGGKEKPESVEKCISSWQRYCPDYEIIEWNEKNVDIQNSDFMKVAYENKKWAFVSDYARYKILFENGGIYLDTDVEIIKNLDDLLDNKAYMGFESNEYVNTGLGFGSIREHPLLGEIINFYNQMDLKKHLKNIEKITTPIIVTNILNKRGLMANGEYQDLGDIKIYPTDYFSPKSPYTRLINITQNTYSIHQFDATWVNEEERKYIDGLEEDAKKLSNKQKDLVSIIIPVYNGEKYLREAIDSALSQTYKNIEVIVVNDGSTDNSEEIAKSYGSRIRYFKKENGGVSSALNMGLEKMRGYYFSWLSHDDLYYPEKIEKQVAYARKFDDKTIVISNWTIINANGEFIEDKHLDSRLEKLPTCFLAFDRKTWLNGCAMLIPKAIFEEFGNFNEKLRSTQDYEMWFRISRKIQFKILPDCLLFSRAHKDQGSLTLPTAIEDSDFIHSEIIDSLAKEEVKEFFKKNFNEILTVFESFYSNGYKRTPAKILEFIIKDLISNGNIQKASNKLQDILIGKIKHSESEKNKNKIIFQRILTKKRKKRLLFFSAHWFTGGVERVLSNLFQELKGNYEIYLITPYTEQEGCIQLPKEVLHIKVSDNSFYNNYDFVVYTYALLLDADVVIGCMNLFEKVLNFYKLARGSKFKTVASNHEYYLFPYFDSYFWPLVNKREEAFSFANATIHLTNFSTAISNIFNKNSYLIPNPNTFQVQLEDRNRVKEEIILSIGRFNDPVKRVDRILLCFKRVLLTNPNAKLVLVGKVDINLPFSCFSTKSLKEFLQELGLPENSVIFAGEVQDMSKYYSTASVLLLTSNNEGFPMIINEAACFGVPSVCNYIPGLEDIITDGINGYLVPQNDIETLADRVVSILGNRSLRTRLGKQAKKLARRFSREEICNKWDILIKILTEEYSSEEQEKLLSKNLGFEIQDSVSFANSLGKEMNSIILNNIDYLNIKKTEFDNLANQYSIELLRVENELNEVKKDLNKVLSSKSWLITLPLRKFYKLINLFKTQGFQLTLRNILLKIIDKLRN